MAYAQVVAASRSNVTISSPGASMDGVTLSVGQRVLLTGQSTTSQNGVWTWQGSAVAMTRPTSPDQYKTGNVLDNALQIWVTGGSTLAGSVWGIDPAQIITVDTTGHTLARVSLPAVFARVATTASLNLASTFTQIDTVNLVGNGAAGSDVVLVKDQTTSSENGLYWANTSGAMVRTCQATRKLTPSRH